MKISIAGIQGRMGQTVKAAVEADSHFTFAASSDKEIKTPITELVSEGDAVIDFTSPAYTLDIAREVAKQGKIHIIGTTGFSEAQLQELKSLSGTARIVQSGNMSIGVNVVKQLVERAAALLREEYDVEILEMHHKHKVDAPSGTALLLADAAASGRGVDRKTVAHMYAQGHTGAREPGSIGIAVRRGGGVVGEHTVSFAGEHEVIDISHRSFSRDIYAAGALQAALWVQHKNPGFYTMADVIG